MGKKSFCNNILCEDCRQTIKNLISAKQYVDMVITSPPYNTSNKAHTKARGVNDDTKRMDWHFRYDGYVDSISNDDYIKFILEVMIGLEKCLVKNGVIAFNLSYGTYNPILLYDVIYNIIHETPLLVAEQIAWRKLNNGIPITSRNRLSRAVEPVFIIVRKTEYDTFNCYKKLGSGKYSTKQVRNGVYENISNFVETQPNDGSVNLNKATFSSDLVMFLAKLYCKKGGLVYDPFMGTGTTAVGAKMLGMKYLGSELSELQCKFAKERIDKGLRWMNVKTMRLF